MFVHVGEALWKASVYPLRGCGFIGRQDNLNVRTGGTKTFVHGKTVKTRGDLHGHLYAVTPRTVH